MLALADLDIKTDRVLYLNPHTIITSSLDGLLELDFEKNIMALAYDTLTNQHKATNWPPAHRWLLQLWYYAYQSQKMAQR